MSMTALFLALLVVFAIVIIVRNIKSVFLFIVVILVISSMGVQKTAKASSSVPGSIRRLIVRLFR